MILGLLVPLAIARTPAPKHAAPVKHATAQAKASTPEKAVVTVRSSDLSFLPQSALEFHSSATLGAFEGSGPFAGHIDVGALKGELDVPTASLTTGSGPRDARLLSYCLEAPKFSEITFRATSMTGDVAALRSGSGAGSVTLTGPLTIRDVTRAVSVPASFRWDGGELHMSGRYDLLWSDFGVPDPSIILSTLDPAMYVTFDIVAGKAAP